MHVSCQNVTAKRRIVFAQKDRLLNYILKHYGVNSGFMRKKVMNPSFPGHAPGKDTLRAANAATKVGANGGENNRTSFLRSKVVCSPVKIKIPVASADMRRHSDTLRGAQRRRKRGSRGENRISGANSVVFPSFPESGG